MKKRNLNVQLTRPHANEIYDGQTLRMTEKAKEVSQIESAFMQVSYIQTNEDNIGVEWKCLEGRVMRDDVIEHVDVIT